MSRGRRPTSPPAVVVQAARHRWWPWLLGVAVLLAVAWFAFDYGRQQAGFDSGSAQREREALTGRLAQLEQEESRLRQELVRLKRTSEIDQHAAQIVRNQVQATQDELLHLKEELAFYRGIVSPQGLDRGLHIQSVKVRSVAEADRFEYRVVLVQVVDDDRVQGFMNLEVRGVENDQTVAYPLSELSARAPVKPEGRKVGFRAFQVIDGFIDLPQAFDPGTIVVTVAVTGKKKTSVTRVFDWPQGV